jgi:FKBP-type peptidyl-prolyl cis-trans isomerase SlyD
LNINKDLVVRFHYTLKDEAGETLDSSEDAEPMTYLHGHGGLLPGLEDALAGKTAGDKLDVTLSPEKAFGERVADAEQRIPVKHLVGAKKWKPGMTAVVHTQHGHRQVTVLKVGQTMATVDTNHPLAGKTLTFTGEVVDVREATPEELSHGHAHGPGGHHH